MPSNLSLNVPTYSSIVLGTKYIGGEIGIMITPSRESCAACSSVIVDRGVSRKHRMSLNRSLSATCAVRVISVSPTPEAILPSVEVEHGKMTNASK